MNQGAQVIPGRRSVFLLIRLSWSLGANTLFPRSLARSRLYLPTGVWILYFVQALPNLSTGSDQCISWIPIRRTMGSSMKTSLCGCVLQHYPRFGSYIASQRRRTSFVLHYQLDAIPWTQNIVSFTECSKGLCQFLSSANEANLPVSATVSLKTRPPFFLNLQYSCQSLWRW